MKRFLISLVAIVFFACSVAMSACTKTPSTSTAVTKYELMRENYAAEKEAEDDAKGREHIEIPDGAEVIEKDGEEWIVINSSNEAVNKIWRGGETALSKNYILAADLILGNNYPSRINKDKIFQGKFDGNNYKIYATEKNGGLRRGLFHTISGALIENVIFSAADGSFSSDSFTWGCLLFEYSYSSTIRNCINYWQPKLVIECRFMGGTKDTWIENCVNYADLYVGDIGGGIVFSSWNGKIIDCKNFGNISSYYYNKQCGVGGIVGRISGESVIDNCINYGEITGESNFGGIVGSGLDGQIDSNNIPKNQLIKNCKNYGNIYLKKVEGDIRVEAITWESIYSIGGIAGAATKIENCKNEGNFYGFESFGKGINVDYSGGIVGIAKEVINCTTTYTIPVQKGRAKNVGEIYGILL